MKTMKISAIFLGLLVTAVVMIYAATQPKAADLVVTTQQQEVGEEIRDCRYPDDLDCPLTPEQKALLDVGHDINPEVLKDLDPVQQ
jgi:hypothetical protein